MSMRRWLAAAITLSLLAVLAAAVDWGTFWPRFAEADYRLLALGVATTAVFPLLGARRWQWVLKSVDATVPFSRSLRAVLFAFALNLAAPAKSGDLVKALLLRDLLPMGRVAGAVIAERLGDLWILAVLAMIGGLLWQEPAYASVAAALLFGLTVFTLWISRWQPAWLWAPLRKIWRIFSDGGTLWREHIDTLLRASLWSLAMWGIAAVQVWLFYLALDTDIALGTVMALFPLTVLASLLPLTPGALGVREATFALLFIDHAEPAVSVSVSLGYFLCNYGLIGLAGTLIVNTEVRAYRSAAEPKSESGD